MVSWKKKTYAMKFQKNYFLIVLLSAFVFSASNLYGQEVSEKDTSAFALLEFVISEHNFGDIQQGEKVEFSFTFKNNGTVPLIISNVLATCGCTAPEWPKNPISPEGQEVIKVVFDSSSKIGRQNKVITVRSNSKTGDARLRISAMVLPAQKKKD